MQSSIELSKEVTSLQIFFFLKARMIRFKNFKNSKNFKAEKRLRSKENT